MKVVPFFTFDFTSTEALCACRMLSVDASPSPIPLRFEVKKGSKSLDRFSWRNSTSVIRNIDNVTFLVARQ
jgi:hypothetical protein